MRILIDICHPAHVHFFKYAIYHWRDQGYEVLLTARDKDVTLRLLDHYGLDYHVLTSAGHGKYGLVSEFIKHVWKLIRVILQVCRQQSILTAIPQDMHQKNYNGRIWTGKI